MKPRPVSNPKNRFDRYERVYDEEAQAAYPVEIIEDQSRTVLSHNDSPDIGFDWSVNPYRGCLHACAYCYARPTHEYLGLGAGTDFDTRIVVKKQAPALLRAAFDKPSWKGDVVVFSGVTDCYQPIESELQLTRGCLEVCAEYRNPVGLITKSVLIERDLDLLKKLRDEARVQVRLSIPFLDKAHARAIEPWAPSPSRRLQAIEVLAKAGIDVGVNVAPVIPGLNDEQMPQILEAARNAGATRASWILLRLPGAVAPVFEERLTKAFPDRARKVMTLVKDTRGGDLYQPSFFQRGRGTGVFAKTIGALFDSTTRRLGYRTGFEADDAPTTFRRPPKKTAQLGLF